LKTTRAYVNIIDAYHELGSYRAAARLCGTTDKTVRRTIERQQAGGPWFRRPRPVTRNTDPVLSVLAKTPSTISWIVSRSPPENLT
jgi:hypothetical protein